MQIPNPDPEEVAAGRTTVYDTWVHRRPDPFQPDLPLMQLIGSGSDYKGFQHNIGVPCMDTRYTHDNVCMTVFLIVAHVLLISISSYEKLYLFIDVNCSKENLIKISVDKEQKAS